MDIALDLSDALTRAHRLNLIHRDIKPANVLLAEDGTPRLTDFGVARFGDTTRMTQTGALVGTLAYFSPESCTGVELDFRADIWSFGVMLYEMLTLERPFDADNTAALLTAILSKEPGNLAELRLDAPLALVAMIEQMLVKERADRIPSVRLIGAQVEAIIRGEEPPTQITPTPPTTTPSDGDTVDAVDTITPAPPIAPSRPSRRGPIFGVVGVGLVTIMLILAGLSFLGSDEEEKPEAILVDPVPEDYRMVLVAQIEHVGGAERDVTRFIVEDLTRRFEQDVPFSNISIRQYPGVITSEEQALEIAEENGGTVIIWGKYDDESVDVEIQLGSLVSSILIYRSRAKK